MSLFSRKSPEDLPQDIRQKALIIKAKNGNFDAIRFLAMDHKVGLFEAKQFIEGHDVFGRPVAYKNRSVSIIGKVFLTVAFILLAIAFSIYYLQEDFIKHSTSTTGTVVEMISDGGTYAPVIGYEINGIKYNKQLNIWTDPPAYEVNENIHIWVSDKKPEDILVDSITGRFLSIMILSALGFIFGIIGAVFRLLFRNTP